MGDGGNPHRLVEIKSWGKRAKKTAARTSIRKNQRKLKRKKRSSLTGRPMKTEKGGGQSSFKAEKKGEQLFTEKEKNLLSRSALYFQGREAQKEELRGNVIQILPEENCPGEVLFALEG